MRPIPLALVILAAAGCSPAPPPLVIGEGPPGWPRLYARAGEFVVRENGEPVAIVSRDMLWGAPFDRDGELSGWAVAPPAIGAAQADPPGRRWWRGPPDHPGFDLHFARGWGDDTSPPGAP